MRPAVLYLAIALQLPAQHTLVSTLDQRMRGAALHRGTMYTWGTKALRWNLSNGKQHTLASAAHGGFGEGGCIDTRGMLYLQDGIETGPLVSIAPNGVTTELDRRVEMHDCIAAELLGRRGVLITDHYGQVRFYEGPGVYQEVYSFYTPSRQAGLRISDVDGDGLPDIFAGNYWIRSPKLYDLPWQLFAINTRHETPDSATLTLALRGRELYAAQGHMSEGLVLRYSPGTDPKQLWTEKTLATLRYPHALASAQNEIVVGENNGPGSRLFITVSGDHLIQIGTTDGIHSAFVTGNRILTVGARTVTWWDIPRIQRQRNQLRK
jgi:hypothetical protein